MARHKSSAEGNNLSKFHQLAYLVIRERSRSQGGQGGLGGGGQGETEIVLQRGRIQHKIRKLKQEIEAVRKTRNVHRQGRRRHRIPVVAVVGYTNAGRSKDGLLISPR